MIHAHSGLDGDDSFERFHTPLSHVHATMEVQIFPCRPAGVVCTLVLHGVSGRYTVDRNATPIESHPTAEVALLAAKCRLY